MSVRNICRNRRMPVLERLTLMGSHRTGTSQDSSWNMDAHIREVGRWGESPTSGHRSVSHPHNMPDVYASKMVSFAPQTPGATTRCSTDMPLPASGLRTSLQPNTSNAGFLCQRAVLRRSVLLLEGRQISANYCGSPRPRHAHWG